MGNENYTVARRCLPIWLMSGEVVGGGHRPPTVLFIPVGPVELHRTDRAATLDGDIGAA
jgi:hypothetical protein